MARIPARPALLMGAAVLVPMLLAGCQQPAPAESTATPAAAPAPPPAYVPDPMAVARQDVDALDAAIQSQNQADALSALDRIQADLPHVGMRSDTQARILAGVTRTRRDVSGGAWSAAAQEVAATRSALASGRGGGGA